MIINKDDSIVTAWGEYASGPGWSNRPIWIIIRNRVGELRQECIQPKDQTTVLLSVFKFSALAHTEMVGAIEAWRKGKKK